MKEHRSAHAIAAVGIVVPVHDEEALLPGALHALELAIDAMSPSISCNVAIVLDQCRDASSAIAHFWAARFGALVIDRDSGNVGLARQVGTTALLELWPGVGAARVWLATTDADSRVPKDWLNVQLEAARSADMWAGRVHLPEESATARAWRNRYDDEQDPVHGASLGFSAALHAQLGGFRGLRTGEDRDLHKRAKAAGFRITHGTKAPVTTSARRTGRAPCGFASVLESIEAIA